MESLNALRVFAKAAELRSFTDAGNQLSLTASAVGKAVSRLEERLGVRLFRRNTRSITLTAEGQQFLDSCRRIFTEIDSIESGFAIAKGKPTGKLRVSLPMVGMLMMPTITEFMREYPEIELDLDFSDHLVDIVNDGFDVVVRTGDISDSRLIARSLGHYHLIVVASPAYLKRSGRPHSPLDLVHHTCLHLRFPTSGKLQRWPFVTPESGNDVSLPVAGSSSTIGPLVTLAEAGAGICCVPDFAVRMQLENGSLISLLAEHLDFVGTFRAVWPASPFLSPKLRVFVDYLSSKLPLRSEPRRLATDHSDGSDAST